MSKPDATGGGGDAAPTPDALLVALALIGRLLLIAVLAAVLAASLKLLCSLLVELSGSALQSLSGVVPWQSLKQLLFDAGKSMLAPLTLALAASGLSGTALVATFKECAKAVETVLHEFPRVSRNTKFKASYNVGISLTALFATIIFARTYVKIDEAINLQVDTTVTVPNFKPGDVLDVAIPFNAEAGLLALKNAGPVAAKSTGVDLDESTRRFLRQFGISLAACRDAEKPVKVVIEGYASRASLKTETPLSIAACGKDATCKKNFAIVETLAVDGGAAISLDDRFNLWAARRRAMNVAACLTGHESCRARDDRGDSGLKWDNKEVIVRDWRNLAEMRTAGGINELNTGLEKAEERATRGAIARYALVRVRSAGKCHEEDVLAVPIS